MAVTALPKPTASRSAAKGGSKSKTVASLEAKIKRSQALVAKAKQKAQKTGKAVIHSLEIQAATFSSSFASGWLRAKGKSLKVMGVDARLPIAGITGIGGVIAGGEAGDHALAVANGVMASLTAEMAFDLGVKAAKKGNGEEAVEGIHGDDDDDDDDDEDASVIRLTREEFEELEDDEEDDSEVGFLLLTPLAAAAAGAGAAAAANSKRGRKARRKVRARIHDATAPGGRKRRGNRKKRRAAKRGGGGQAPQAKRPSRKPFPRNKPVRDPEYDEAVHLEDDDYSFDAGDDDWDWSEFDQAVSELSHEELADLTGTAGDENMDGSELLDGEDLDWSDDE